VERHDADLDEGLDRLLRTLDAQPAGATPAQLCSALTEFAGSTTDDVAIIAVRLG
jgi:hypothetical protein